ncbi:MAG: hypothetical protein ACJAWV_002093 [Flammeovirgaceae bacterium]|jgi:hypothetical protein
MLKNTHKTTLLFLLFFSTVFAHAQSVINVPNGGSIQNAIENARDGDTIKVAAGVFVYR